MLTTLLKPARAAQPRCWRRRREPADAVAATDRVRAALLSAGDLLTSHENVVLFARLFGIPRRVRRERVDATVSAMGLTEATSRLAKTCPSIPRPASVPLWLLIFGETFTRIHAISAPDGLFCPDDNSPCRTGSSPAGGRLGEANPLSYEVNAPQNLLIGLPTNLWPGVGVLAGSAAAAITVAPIHWQMVTRERHHADPGKDAD